MPLNDYGVLVGRAVERRREGDTDTPHYQIRLLDDAGAEYRVAVNVKSQQAPSELLYLVDDDVQHPVTARASAFSSGWTDLPPSPAGGLDFIRGNLFDRAELRLLPADATGPDNDLADLLDHYVLRALGDATARVYAFGERWGPEPVQDKIFGFQPGAGVHDIHMNQGNVGRFTADDGVWQDGGLLLHFPAESRWVGIFLAFQSQAWHTDDITGHALEDVPTTPTDGRIPVRLLAAMVNPTGPAPEAESVLLLNASAAAVDLTGWRIADREGRTCALPSGPLAAGAVLRVPTADGVALGNRGGTVTLLDAAGLKVHGVAYTAEAASVEGWTVTF